MAKKKADWYDTGDAGRERLRQRREEAQARRSAMDGPQNFRLDAGAKGKATFLDTPEFVVKMHHCQIGNRWGYYFTCIDGLPEELGLGPCPICHETEFKAGECLLGTVISHVPWQRSSDGKIINNQKQLIILKYRAIDAIQEEIGDEDDLRFCTYKITRPNHSNSVSCGEIFKLKGRLTEEQVLSLERPDTEGDDDEYLEPFDYAELFAPKTAAELRKLLSLPTPVGAEEDSDDDDDDDSKPESKTEKKKKTETKKREKKKVPANGGTNIDDLL